MKYALLIHQGDSPTPHDPEAWDQLSETEQEAIFAEYRAVSSSPGVVAAQRLQAPETATTVRVADGETLTTDGPRRLLAQRLGELAGDG